MAIKADLDFNGLAANGAYARVLQIGISRIEPKADGGHEIPADAARGFLIRANIGLFASEEIARRPNGAPFSTMTAQVVYDGVGDPLALIYAEIKADPRFAPTAIDC